MQRKNQNTINMENVEIALETVSSEIILNENGVSVDVIRKNVKKMYLISIFASMDFISPVLVLFFLEWGQISFLQILLLQSWFAACIFLFEVPTGSIADRFGRKKSIVMGLAVLFVGALVYTWTPNLYMFMLGECLFALGLALISGAKEALMFDSLKEIGEENQASDVFGNIVHAELTGIIIGALLGSVIAVRWGFRETMQFMAFPIGVAFIIALSLREPAIEKGQKSSSYLEFLKSAFEYIKNHQALRRIAWDYLIIRAVAFFVIWTWQIRLISLNVDIAYFGLVNVLMLVAQMLVIRVARALDRKFTRKRWIFQIHSLCVGIGFVMMAISDNILCTLIGIIMVVGFGFGKRPFSMAEMNKHIPSEQRATTISTVSMFFRMIMMILFPLLGYLVEISLTAVLLGLGIFAIVFVPINPLREQHFAAEIQENGQK